MKRLIIESPSDFPDVQQIDRCIRTDDRCTILVPKEYLGAILALCEEKRACKKNLLILNEERIILRYRLPLNEVATDFYDQLKSLSSGYASLDYEEAGYQAADLVKMDILLNGKAG